eukprot:TRINITY_DN4946_c0_g1_i2.p2 TRINITY_DN4946_c0_g1~~TRINITY_DN4946_c0_g1_i2.p2  ORF type:complete len:284 (-),score=90.11 TRINITY_DN4946_c0_g1_i2:1895-2746(-)
MCIRDRYMGNKISKQFKNNNNKKMFILIQFGYKQSRVFTIDCLTATLIDCIWVTCIKDIQKLVSTKEDQMFKELNHCQKKLQKQESKLEEIDKQIKINEEKKLEEEAQDENSKKKKDNKKPQIKAVVKKKGKGQDIPESGLEKDRLDVVAEIEKLKDILQKYQQKLEKLKIYKEKYQDVMIEGFQIDLLDKTGDRKFVKTKADTIANTFLSDKNTYFLGTIQNTEADQEDAQPEVVQLDGFAFRTVGEDEKAAPEDDAPLIAPIDPKGKKGGKKDAKKDGKKK